MTDLLTFENSNIFMNHNLSDLYKNKIQQDVFKNLFDQSFSGGLKTKQDTRLKIMPTFINVLRGRILYNGKTKMKLKKIKPKNVSNVILGTIIDLAKVKNMLGTEKLTNDSIKKFIDMYDFLPLMYNDDESSNVIKNNKKKSFFNTNSKLCLVTFNVSEKNEYYKEIPNEEVSVDFKDVKDVIKEKNFIVSHYIYERNFFLVPTNKININSIQIIDIDENEKEMFKPAKNFSYKENGKSIDLVLFEKIISLSKKFLTQFS